MADEMRIGQRLDLEGDVKIHMINEPETYSVEGYDVSPNAVALLIPLEHEAIEWIPEMLKPGRYLMVEHDLFGNRKTVLHRLFRHKNGKVKLVLSFISKLDLPRE